MSDKWNKLAQYEKAISQKYGEEAIQNPQKDWSEDKEADYQKQLQELYHKEGAQDETLDKVEVDGFLVSKKLLNRDNNRNCPICNIYSFEIRDNIYMNKFDCCFKCYIQWVENREDRWKTGWRPQKEK
jgi:hypothetical protein